jgi:hypothetical protein
MITTKYDYNQTTETWSYVIYDNGQEITNSSNVPPFDQKEDAEESAFSWLLANEYY